MLKSVKKETSKVRRAFLHPTFIFLSIVGTGVLIICTLLVYYLEKGVNPKIENLFDSLWWGVSTITTVGYGDVTPITTGGRLIGVILMYSGTVLFITFTGILVTLWTKEDVKREISPLEKEVLKEEKETARIDEKLTQILDRLERLEKK